MPVGWIVVLWLLGLATAALLARMALGIVRRGRAAVRERARFEDAKRGVEEEVTSLGEEIDLLDRAGTDAEAADWHEALDAYDAAKAALVTAEDEAGLRAVRDIVHRGRDALTRPRTKGRRERL